MADADALLRDGDIAGAREQLVQLVRSQPANEQARMFLFQLLAINGEWDKALKQLESLAQIASEAQMLNVTYHQAIEAEKVREEVFAGKAEMEVLVGADGWANGVASGLSLIAAGDISAGIAARNEAFDNAPDLPGNMDGQKFEWIADADSRFGPTFEAIIAGRYGIVPFDEVSSIKSEGPCDLRDVVWYPVEIMFRSGLSVAAFLPARYPGSAASDDDAVRLARKTDWSDCDWGQEGSGQRLWTLSDGSDVGLLDMRQLQFD